MELKLSDKDIFEWYQHILKMKQSGGNTSKYCLNNGLDKVKMNNMSYKIHCPLQKNNPNLYASLTNHVIELNKTRETISKYCKRHNLDRVKMGEVKVHMSYLEAIERHRKSLEEEHPKMNFIQVKKSDLREPNQADIHLETEVIQAQNDIELIIAKGVKVMISPSVDSIKIIKIIELLKDL